MTGRDLPLAVAIRPARIEDAAEVARLSAAFARYLRSLGDEHPGPLTAQAYRRDGFGARPHFSGIVAERAGGGLLGYALHMPGYDVDRCAPVTLIIDLFIDEHARRKGVGRQLVAELARIAAAGGSAELVWAVYKANRLAYDFYEKLGAEHVTDITLMRLPLRGAGGG